MMPKRGSQRRKSTLWITLNSYFGCMKPVVLVTTFLLSFLSYGQLSDKILDLLSPVVDSLPEGTSISFGILKDDSPSFVGLTKSGGRFILTDLTDSKFEIGSITKTFTSTVLADLILNDKLCLNSKVNKEFPYKWNNKTKVSYQELANHTSGMHRLPSNIFPSMLKNQDDPYSNYTLELLDQYLKSEIQLESETGKKYAYSNLGAGVLAYALSMRESNSFDLLVQDKILTPYQMTNTGFEKKTDIQGLNLNGDPISNWHFNAMKGAGGLISTTNDLSKFVMAQFDQKNATLRLTRESTFEISESMSIGLGWHIISPGKEDQKFWHNGGTGGYTSSIAYRTQNKTGVIVLSNISALSKYASIIDEICFELLDELK